MSRFLHTVNQDGYNILIPVDRISEIILYNQDGERGFSIDIYCKDTEYLVAREMFDTVEEVDSRFDQLKEILNNNLWKMMVDNDKR